MALLGTETLLVLGTSLTGGPAAETFQTTTGAIAALASSEGVGETAFTAITTVGAGTLTAAAIIGGGISRSGPVAAYTDTTDTAANIVAAIGAPFIGQSFYLRIKNLTAFAETLSAGSGVTITGAAIIPPNFVGTYLVTLTSLSAVTFFHVSTGSISGDTPEVITTLSTVGAGTITGAGIAGGVTSRTGSQSSTPFTDTTDTAANIILGRNNARIGQAWEYTYVNTTNAAATIAGGTGVTPSGITVVPANAAVKYLVTYTAAATITMVAINSSFATTGSAAPTAVGSALTVTAPLAGTTLLLNTAAGSTATLPAATGTGNVYKFVVTTTATSNAHKILAASSSDFLNGIAIGHVSAGTTLSFSAAAATAHSIQMPFAGTQPSGGFIGDWFEFTDAATNLWTVRGAYQSGTTSTTPFSAATS